MHVETYARTKLKKNLRQEGRNGVKMPYGREKRKKEREKG